MDKTTPTSPVSGTGESSATGDNGELENDTQGQNEGDDDQTDVSDYLGSEDDNTSKIEEDGSFKKRYADSSREAQRLAKEVEAKQKEIDDWVQFVESDPELAEAVKNKTGKPFGKEVEKLTQLETRLANIEKKERELTIKSFESDKKALGFVFNHDVRRQIGEIAKNLESVDVPYEEALEIAYIRLNKTGIVKQATESGKKQAFAQSKVNSEATYTTSNSAQNGTQSFNLSKEEQEYIKNMPGTPEEKKRFIEFHKSKQI